MTRFHNDCSDEEDGCYLGGSDCTTRPRMTSSDIPMEKTSHKLEILMTRLHNDYKNVVDDCQLGDTDCTTRL
jgi:hypothetical protein